MTNYNSHILFIHFSANNILFTVTDLKGELAKTITAGSFKAVGVKKVSLTSIKTAVLSVSAVLHNKTVHIKCRGMSRLKRLVFKLVLKIPKLNVLTICDLTVLPHNGVRKPKIRRV